MVQHQSVLYLKATWKLRGIEYREVLERVRSISGVSCRKKKNTNTQYVFDSSLHCFVFFTIIVSGFSIYLQ